MIYLGEGNTPLIKSSEIGKSLGLTNLFFKLETVNPTGSFKDRFASFAVSHMIQEGKNLCLATSSGNTGASLSAYCAAAKKRCAIAVVDGITKSKIQQMLSYGAELFEVAGFGKKPHVTGKILQNIKKLAEAENASLQISAYKYSPLGMSGVESISIELVDKLMDIDHVFCPAGGGGLTLSVVRGFEKLFEFNKIRFIPKIHCVQPEGNDTMATSIRNNLKNGKEVQCKTKISGLQVPNLIDANAVIKKLYEHKGTGHLVSDKKVLTVQKMLASTEGVFCEPAGATSVAGLFEAVKNNEVLSEDHIVCLITGSGFKDSDSLFAMANSGKHIKIKADQLSEEIMIFH